MSAAREPPDLLICALSARAMAQSARRGGLRPAVIDAFADLDTRVAAVAWAKAPLRSDWRFEPAALLALARGLAPPSVPLVYGSGFERDPELLAALAEGRPLIGTLPTAFARTLDPSLFAEACHRFGLLHPETRADPPSHPAGWLAKRRGGAGGGHVRPAAEVPVGTEEWYFQRQVPGIAVSLLLLCDGRGVVPLAITRQWTAPGRGFRFSGVSLPEDLPDAAGEALRVAAATLAVHFGVRGFASLDALFDGEHIWVLELNARPTASLEALELATGASMLELHRRAVEGILPRQAPEPRRAAASEIVFVPEDCVMPDGFRWPRWAGDRTPGGTAIARNGPVATVVATASEASVARREVCRRRELLLARLRAAGAFATEQPT